MKGKKAKLFRRTAEAIVEQQYELENLDTKRRIARKIYKHIKKLWRTAHA